MISFLRHNKKYFLELKKRFFSHIQLHHFFESKKFSLIDLFFSV